MFKLGFYCLSVTIEDLNLQQQYRYEDINISSTQYLVLLDAISGTLQAHDTSVFLIFPALLKYQYFLF